MYNERMGHKLYGGNRNIDSFVRTELRDIDNAADAYAFIENVFDLGLAPYCGALSTALNVILDPDSGRYLQDIPGLFFGHFRKNSIG